MNLSELVKTVEKTSKEFKKGSIEYNGETVTFQYRENMSVSDYEYIFFDQTDDNQSVMARRIARLVKDDDGEPFALDDVLTWPIDLVLIIAAKTVPDDSKKKTEKTGKKK